MLLQWKMWGLMHAFAQKFGSAPIAPEGLHPAELSRLMHKSLLSGVLAAPLTLTVERIHINVAACSIKVSHTRRSAKLRAYLDKLDPPHPGKQGNG